MSAEILRRAAALMRERAEAARLWMMEDGQRRAMGWHTADELADNPFDPEHAEHIASWHPAVALAVSDWLDTEADVLDDPHERGHARPTPARAVACAYLGEAS